MNARTKTVAAVMAAVTLLTALLVSLQSAAPAAAAPPAALPAAPTPVAVTMGGKTADVALFWERRVMTQAAPSAAQNIADHDKIDLQWVVDQGTTPNTVTLRLQFSNDCVNWIDGPAAVTNSGVDANDMQQYALFGRCARVSPTLANTQPLTLTVIGVAK